ncbi:MAG: hypothetical protein J0L86_09405 [Flavobacteriales bacterium]|nr:hypothetical protein [Flavobacteriales bacterium]
MSTLKIYPGEEFREIELEDKLIFRYAVSNRGRLISFSDEIKNGRLLNGSKSDGYKMFRYRMRRDGKVINKHFFVCKLVAQHFVPKFSEDQTYVLHLDRVRDNDDYRNLRWATREEMIEHSRKSPFVIQAKKNLLEHNIKSDGKKLTVTKVILIKKLLAKPDRKTRLKMIAKQFGVSEMQIRRIKSGENWGHIKI